MGPAAHDAPRDAATQEEKEEVVMRGSLVNRGKNRWAMILKNHRVSSDVADMPLQQVRATDLERYYADLKAAPATVQVHHAILHRALRKAVRDHLLTVNPASDLECPKTEPERGHARAQ